jgi:hypothetical protein
VAASRRAFSAALFAVHTAALLVALWLWIPMYRRLVAGPGGDHPGAGVVEKLLFVVIVMQACYWIRRQLPRPAPRHHDLLGHVLLFSSRLAFVFVGSSFSLFVIRAGDTRPSPGGMAISIWALFAIFCYVLELEEIARPRLGSSHA